jgi:hypothetical protein
VHPATEFLGPTRLRSNVAQAITTLTKTVLQFDGRFVDLHLMWALRVLCPTMHGLRRRFTAKRASPPL